MKNKILFVVALLFGLMFLNAGLDKFFHYMPMPEDMPEEMQKTFAAYMQIGWLLPLVGVVEIVGGLLVIIPRTRALGALVILPVMVGIVLANTTGDTSGLPLVAVMSAILVWIMVENREKYAPLFK
ncbi:DoxX family protein [Flavobacterium capsici]|uniref:DoxX family protein n=1 Tax=Flavobacterium capsici TaxID=3075618 RepID=A0AA96F6P9_9FLAO|nr:MULTISPECIES: DoxX family protein [unclassified Flavobacterium]WNM18559.1 DoxX family protein [Flavobacterium sp. PMR2A8]WNM22610.1 DoxX family protein [Flavobacterium sp. PMTSA4]